MWKRDLEKEMWTRFQVQLEEDGGSSTGQSWMETSSLWPMVHRERQGLSQVSQVSQLLVALTHACTVCTRYGGV